MTVLLEALSFQTLLLYKAAKKEKGGGYEVVGQMNPVLAGLTVYVAEKKWTSEMF